MEYLSYLMGAETIADTELEALGAVIVGKSKSGNRKLKIPALCIAAYESLVREKIDAGFWNEYIGPNRIHFIFKLKDGTIKEYDLSTQNEQEIDKLCAELNNELPETTANVYKYISENDFYHNMMLKYWSQNISRPQN